MLLVRNKFGDLNINAINYCYSDDLRGVSSHNCSEIVALSPFYTLKTWQLRELYIPETKCRKNRCCNDYNIDDFQIWYS